jgi:hypothetical protein
MENKKKPSVLGLVPDHHDLQEDKPAFVLFSMEMLEWPVKKHFEGPESSIGHVTIIRKALEALASLYPFNARISLGVHISGGIKYLYFPKRVWGEIYLDDKCVLTFSHDTRYDNAPFYSIVEWPELKSDSCSWELTIAVISEWTVEDWRAFFRERLLKRATLLKSKASEKRKDAFQLEKSAWHIVKALDQKEIV